MNRHGSRYVKRVEQFHVHSNVFSCQTNFRKVRTWEQGQGEGFIYYLPSGEGWFLEVELDLLVQLPAHPELLSVSGFSSEKPRATKPITRVPGYH